MSPSLLQRLLGGGAGAFVRQACSRGIKRGVAKALEPAAREIAPEDPQSILESRELFEQAAMRTVIGDAGNLELSFGLVDGLASAVEELGLARASDVPDPFRRVWVENPEGRRRRGVVLTLEREEISVFCPPASEAIASIGSPLILRYRGFSSSVQYELLLNDSVSLPGTQILHLTRLAGSGAIGRGSDRYSVSIEALAGFVPKQDEGAPEPPVECHVIDLSSGGVQFVCTRLYQTGDTIDLRFPIPDGEPAAFHVRGEIMWIGGACDAGHSQGLRFQELNPRDQERLDMYLRCLRHESLASGPGVS